MVDDQTTISGIPHNPTDNNWTTISGIKAANDSTAADGETYNTNIAFHIYEGADAAWIDDVTLYELADGTDNEKGNNLIKDGGFEYGEWGVSGYSFKKGNNTANNLTAGEITGKVDVFNFSKENFNAVAATALYKDGDLIDSYIVNTTNIPIMTNPFSPTQLGGTVTVPDSLDTGVYEIKIFLWDSFTNCKALTLPGVLTE